MAPPPSKKRKLPSTTSEDDRVAAQELLRKHFESQFALPIADLAPIRKQDTPGQQGDSGAEEDWSEGSWSGLDDGSDEDEERVVEVVDYSGVDNQGEGWMDKKERRSFMVYLSLPPSPSTQT
jgi:hypothetical protein